VQPYPSDWRARMVRRTAAGRASPILAGLSSVALYERNSVDDVWTVTGENVVELATAGAVASVGVGKGTVLIERLAWDTPIGLAHKRWADHALNVLATNLRVPIDVLCDAPRKSYRAEDFETIDLRAVCNRGFRDESAGDGKGGWTDQGPDNDLRGMRTGLQTFMQIRFDIVNPDRNQGRSCIVLHSAAHDPAAVAATDPIPVNRRAKALFFLHTGAWVGPSEHAGKALIRYVVTYADGTQASVQALGGKHIRDWWTPGQCEEALGVALLLQPEAEADVSARRRGLQIQEWTNPQPEKEVRSIRIESGETGAIPVVLAIALRR
jgi:beta-galactosidase